MESILDILYIPMGYLIRFAYSLTDNYLFAILFFTLVIEILLCPLAIKQQKNQIKQAKLAPKITAIEKKYAGREDQVTMQKKQQEKMELYKKENASPMGGCGPLLIQFPIIICLYNVIINPLRYICNIPNTEITALTEYLKNSGVEIGIRNSQIDIINAIRDNVSDYFTIAPSLEHAVIPNFSVGPFDLSQTPEISFNPFNWLMLIPVITFIAMIVSQKIMQKFTYQSPESQNAQTKMSMTIMTWSMPLISVFFEFKLAAAIGVYWIFRQIISTVERIIIAKCMPLPKFTAEDYENAERELGLKSKNKREKELREARLAAKNDPNRKPVRSLHHIDDEEYIARHKNDFADDETEECGETTRALGEKEKNAPAPIKNDEKTSYKNKKNNVEKQEK